MIAAGRHGGAGDGMKNRAAFLPPQLILRRTNMRSAFNFAPFRRSTIGFDQLFDLLENSAAGNAGENFPPFDLVMVGDNQYRIDLAVAGFELGEIDITAQQNQLVVTGRKGEDKGPDYIHRGIATRSFERRFGLADHIRVTGAEMKDGLLSIELVREIPEAMKPRKISIGGEGPRAIEVSAESPEKAGA